MTKKFLSMLLALVMCLTLIAPAWAAEESNLYLKEIKHNYVENHCFYQITDANYLDLLADDEIIEVFHNINVTKKLLDDNMVLDIDKVTESDLAAENLSPEIQPHYVEGKHILNIRYDNVVVIKKATVQKGLQYAGTSTYITSMYLSNQGIVDFVMEDWSSSLGKPFGAVVAEWALCTVVGTESPGFGAFLSLAIGYLDSVNASKESIFRNELKERYYNGERVVVTMTAVSRSCENWPDRCFYTEDGSRNGLDITSEYSCYNNKEVG